MASDTRGRRAVAIGAPLIGLVVVGLFAASYLLSNLAGLPSSFALPVPVRLLGAAIAVLGLAVIGWTFEYRGPLNVIASTYVTLGKAILRVPAAEMSGRREPLVVGGPQRYVRSPLYFGVVVMVLGLALLSADSFVFVATPVLLLWFGLVVIPFEERELGALFGEQWKGYSEVTPMLIPFTKRGKRGRVSGQRFAGAQGET